MYSIAIYTERNIAVFHFQGEMTLTEGRQAFVEYVQRHDFQPDALMITDARDVTAVSADFLGILGGVQSLGAAFKHFRKAAKSVILVSDDVQLGSARMLSQVLDLIGPIQVVIVRAERELRAQTGLSFSELDGLKQVVSDAQAPLTRPAI